MSMTPELEKYYEQYFDLFVTDGWKQFISDISANLESFDIRSIEKFGDLRYSQGQIKVIDQIMNWETLIRNTYAELEQDAS
jgi:hypothetical protein